MQSLVGGVSGALILRFEARDRSWVLRVEPERIALEDRQRGFTCMLAAAAAGAAPKVIHADAASGLAIMDFIVTRPVLEHPGGPIGLARALGALSTRVRATDPFPKVGDYPVLIGNMLTRLGKSSLLAPGLLDPHAEGLARIRAALPWNEASLVSSHNDPNPRNILFDGERLWLIDWELAGLNDPLVDIAILTNDLANTPEMEDELLHAAFPRQGRFLRARLGVVRVLTRLFYGCIVLETFAAVSLDAPIPTLAGVSPAAFRRLVADGKLASGAPETAYAFAMMSLAEFIRGVTAPVFAQTLEMASQA